MQRRSNILRYQQAPRRSHGNILVNVYNETVANPIDEAQVDIFGFNSNGEEMQIESLITNDSGQTEEMPLDAPPADYSLSPQDEVRPFNTYTIRVNAPDFEPTVINGVEIFDTTTAIQNVHLVPRTTGGAAHVVDIAENTLWGDYPPKIPEDEVKPLPAPTGLVVLDKVVIPEFIVVHDGPPDSYAQNYWVPFKDYIKNVASSEIYSTWPTQTIRANVLVILSFTLNRVFTEWYRGQGKDFTITSNTAFDQKFSYGRNIFTEISNVVDEIFTNYVTREGILQPLLTQYCDGKRVNCPDWLSQWGSAALGEQGMSSMDILRNYYGNIYLDTAPIVSGVPVSYPGHSLQAGSSGAAVRTIQNQLNAISNNYPLIPKLRVDGIYGQQTADSVRIFQGIFNMPQTGVVDFATWYRISHIYVAVTRLATLV